MKSMMILLLTLAIGVAMVVAAPSRPLPPLSPPPVTPGLDSRQDRVTLPWFESFESGAPGWVTSGFFNVIADPQLHQVMNPTIHPNLVTLPDGGILPSAHGGNHALWYGQVSTGTFIGADFDHNQPPLSGGTSTAPNSGWAVTPELDLTGATDVTLSFWTLWEVEGVDIPWFDVMYIEASIDGGTTWMPVGAGALNPLNDVNTNANVGYSSAGVGLPPVWVQHSFSLTPFSGGFCWVRFRFDTIDQLYNGFRGWFIDDLAVNGVQSLSPDIISVTPGAGQGGDLVFVNGHNFLSGAQITFGGMDTEEAVVSMELAQFYVPYLPDGNYDVMLTNPDGQFAVCQQCFEITLIPGPEISFVDPSWAYPGVATPIIIEGQNFDLSSDVTIGGITPMDIIHVNLERITCTTPATLGMGFHAVRVTNPDGQYDQCTGCFEVRNLEAPTNVVIRIVGLDALLDWTGVPTPGAEYKIYRDTIPNGAFALLVGDVATTSFVDHNALQEPGSQFYIVRAYMP